jgi:type IV pilus assembly protein PilE
MREAILAPKKINIAKPGESGGHSFYRSTGFSVLELVMVLAIIGVLLTIAVPSYQWYVQRAHRAEAIRMMLVVADCQERIRADTGFYDTSRCGENLANDFHEFRIEPADRNQSLEFTVFAKPRPGRDDSCGSLSLDQSGTRSISGKLDALSKCWSGR